ncbi:NAD-dependent protein deacetylase [Agrilactobacillus yilanensis]|uniref:NAD-dependent protein deacetylase n=1 Tax=Agrilactobacillus yilanensis TaxID=2485997 RepID=A0ABW4J6X8_9LACO|nr:NAD-dependent protein deacetylase [Agrilactobacillus yilanensis]
MNDSMYEQLVLQAQMNYQNYYGMYAQGQTPVKLSEKKPLSYDEQIQIFADKIKKANHVIIGGASGLSAAGGGDFYYEDTPSFKKYFGKFAEKYGIKGAFAGVRYPWKTREEYWAYMATFLYTTQHAAVRKPYADLQAILKDKDYFIVTTNQDTQAIKAFPEDKVAQIQGDHRFFQCSKNCTDEVWDATAPVAKMVEAMGDDTKIPSELIPRCPNCGAEAFPWVRGYGNFLEGARYHEEYQKISDDVTAHLETENVVFVELGVGRMTPMFIQEPFWMLTGHMKDSYDIMVNQEYQFLPEFIEDRAQAIKGDIDQVLTDVRQVLGR